MQKTLQPAGFWARTIAVMIDTFMILFPITLVLMLIFGYSELKNQQPLVAGILQMGLYGAIVVSLWVKKGYTPGKKMMRLIVLDSRTQKTMYFPQALWRFVCYFIAMISVVGLLLPIFRKDKKALHDLLSSSLVVRL
ncbi:MAG: RDD family protein [Campylobacterales bacterium]